MIIKTSTLQTIGSTEIGCTKYLAQYQLCGKQQTQFSNFYSFNVWPWPASQEEENTNETPGFLRKFRALSTVALLGNIQKRPSEQTDTTKHNSDAVTKRNTGRTC